MSEIRPGHLFLVHAPWYLRMLGVIYSHAAIAFEDKEQGEVRSVEAVPNGGVSRHDIGWWAEPFDVYEVLGTTLEQGEAAAAAALAREGEAYTYSDILRILVRRFLELLGLRAVATQVVCSPLVDQSWRAAGQPLTEHELPTPDEIAQSPVTCQLPI